MSQDNRPPQRRDAEVVAAADERAHAAWALAYRLAADPTVTDDELARALDEAEAASEVAERELCANAVRDTARAASNPAIRVQLEARKIRARLRRDEHAARRCVKDARLAASKADGSLARVMRSIAAERDAQLARERPRRLAIARRVVRDRYAERGLTAATPIVRACAGRPRRRSPRRPRTARRSSSRSGDSGPGESEPPPRRAARSHPRAAR